MGPIIKSLPSLVIRMVQASGYWHQDIGAVSKLSMHSVVYLPVFLMAPIVTALIALMVLLTALIVLLTALIVLLTALIVCC